MRARAIFSLALCLTIVTASGAHAAPGCVSGPERDALEIKKLSSELMVTSEACQATDRYNAYMHRYQGALTSNEAVLGGYFKRAYGRGYQKNYDDFTTDLANVQMQQGLKSGTAFCGLLAEAFDEVMVLDGPGELADFARSKPLVMPASIADCGATPAGKAPGHKGKGKKKHA